MGLGRQAVALGLETLELARIHEESLAILELSDIKNGVTEIIFAEANTPIQKIQRPSRQAEVDLDRLENMLLQRTEELSDTKRQLQRSILQRKSAKAAIKKRGEHGDRQLKESLQLQDELRQVTQRLLASQEDERTKTSRELQDEIIQTLVGINVRLFSLKQEARSNPQGIKNKIAVTQQLVEGSVRSIRRIARKYSNL